MAALSSISVFLWCGKCSIIKFVYEFHALNLSAMFIFSSIVRSVNWQKRKTRRKKLPKAKQKKLCQLRKKNTSPSNINKQLIVIYCHIHINKLCAISVNWRINCVKAQWATRNNTLNFFDAVCLYSKIALIACDEKAKREQEKKLDKRSVQFKRQRRITVRECE